MKRFAVVLAAVAAVAVCVGIPVTRQAVADPPVRSGNELAGKFLVVNSRESTGNHTTILETATVRRLGNREFLAGEVILLPDDRAQWQGVLSMIPLDQIDSIFMFDDRDKVIKIVNDRKPQANGSVPPPAIPATGIGESVPPPATGIKDLPPIPVRIK